MQTVEFCSRIWEGELEMNFPAIPVLFIDKYNFRLNEKFNFALLYIFLSERSET